MSDSGNILSQSVFKGMIKLPIWTSDFKNNSGSIN